MLPASSDEENMIGSTAQTPKTFSLRPMILFGLLSGLVGVFFGTCLAYQLASGHVTHVQKTDVASAQGLAAQAAEEDAKEDAEKITDNACYQAWQVTEKDDIMFLKALEMCLENFYCWDENHKAGSYGGCQKKDEHHDGKYTLDGNPFFIRLWCEPAYVPGAIEKLKNLKATCAPQWEASRTEEAAETEVQKEVDRRLTAKHAAEAAEENACVQSIRVGQQRVLHLMNVKDICYETREAAVKCAAFAEKAVDDGIEALQAVEEKCASQFQKVAEAEKETEPEAENAEES